MKLRDKPSHPTGKLLNLPAKSQLPISEDQFTLDTFGGRVRVEWEPHAPVTPLGQLPFFVEFLKTGNLFDPWVEEAPLQYTSPNAPSSRDLLGTILLSVLAGHTRYAHIATIRCDGVNPA